MPSAAVSHKVHEILLRHAPTDATYIKFYDDHEELLPWFEDAQIEALQEYTMDPIYHGVMYKLATEAQRFYALFLTRPPVALVTKHINRMNATINLTSFQETNLQQQIALLSNDIITYHKEIETEFASRIAADGYERYSKLTHATVPLNFYSFKGKYVVTELRTLRDSITSLVASLSTNEIYDEVIRFICSNEIEDVVITPTQYNKTPILVTCLPPSLARFMRHKISHTQPLTQFMLEAPSPQVREQMFKTIEERLGSIGKPDIRHTPKRSYPHHVPRDRPSKPTPTQPPPSTEHDVPPPGRRDFFEPGGTDGESSSAEGDDKPPYVPPRKKGESKNDYLKRTKKEHDAYKKWMSGDNDDDSTPEGDENTSGSAGSSSRKDKGKDKEQQGNKKDKTDNDKKDEIEININPTSQDDLDLGTLDSLLWRAKEKLEAFKDRPRDFISSSHLRRFSDSRGLPQHILRSDIHDDDVIIPLFEGEHSVRYLLTFGGEDRHPIFNRIEDQEWTSFS